MSSAGLGPLVGLIGRLRASSRSPHPAAAMLLRLVSLAGLSVRLAQCAQVPFQRQEPLASAGAAIHLTKAHPTVISELRSFEHSRPPC